MYHQILFPGLITLNKENGTLKDFDLNKIKALKNRFLRGAVCPPEKEKPLDKMTISNCCLAYELDGT